MATFRLIAGLRGNLAARLLLQQPTLLSTAVTSSRIPLVKYSSNIKSDSGSGIHDNASGERPTEKDLMPDYVPREGESESVKRARLLYQSRKRGMLENGLLLSTFASCYLDELTPEQLDQYDDLINRPSNDWELYYWITGREETPSRYDNVVMKMLQDHSRNKNKEARYRQPDLKPPAGNKL